MTSSFFHKQIHTSFISHYVIKNMRVYYSAIQALHYNQQAAMRSESKEISFIFHFVEVLLNFIIHIHYKFTVRWLQSCTYS